MGQVEERDLLKAAQNAGFEVLVTSDKNIRFQQNLEKYAIAVVVLGSGQWPILRQHIELVVAAVNAAKPGTYFEIEIPDH
jgi:hypothetical protein